MKSEIEAIKKHLQTLKIKIKILVSLIVKMSSYTVLILQTKQDLFL